MEVVISPSKACGQVNAPPSKSYTHRAVVIASLAKGTSIIKNALAAEDLDYTIKACRALGADIKKEGDNLIIHGTGGNLTIREKEIFVGGSGTTMRFMASVAALAKGEVIFDGTERMRERPISDLLDALNQLGVNATSINSNGCPPVKISSDGLRGGEINISGAVSSQYLSSLLIASPYARADTTINITDELKSKPYVDITLDMMGKFGVKVERESYGRFFIASNQAYTSREYAAEGDFSSASYFLASAAVCGSEVIVKNLNNESVQGDKIFLNLLKDMGCDILYEKDKITVVGPKCLKPIEVDMGDYPDIVQTLAVVAAYAKGTTRINNIEHLKHKETDRINSTADELKKMGVPVNVGKDYLEITGAGLNGAEISSHNDHRMVMSFSVAALGAKGCTTIRGAEAVGKSFPNFFNELKKLGVKYVLKGE